MTSNRTFYRAVYQVEVLSEESFDGVDSEMLNLHHIADAIDTGGDSGHLTLISTEEVSGPKMAATIS